MFGCRFVFLHVIAAVVCHASFVYGRRILAFGLSVDQGVRRGVSIGLKA